MLCAPLSFHRPQTWVAPCRLSPCNLPFLSVSRACLLPDLPLSCRGACSLGHRLTAHTHRLHRNRPSDTGRPLYTCETGKTRKLEPAWGVPRTRTGAEGLPWVRHGLPQDQQLCSENAPSGSEGPREGVQRVVMAASWRPSEGSHLGEQMGKMGGTPTVDPEFGDRTLTFLQDYTNKWELAHTPWWPPEREKGLPPGGLMAAAC